MGERSARSRSFYRMDAIPAIPESALPAAGVEELEPFGVRLGRRVHQARQLRRVQLPEGWHGQGSHLGVWCSVADQYGRTRAVVHWTYRHRLGATDALEAHPKTIVLDVHSYIVRVEFHREPFVVDAQWATRSAVIEVIDERLACLERIAAGRSAALERWGNYSLGDESAEEALRACEEQLRTYRQLRRAAATVGARHVARGPDLSY